MRSERLTAAQVDAQTLAPLLEIQFAAWRRDRAHHHPAAQESIVLLGARPAGLVSTERADGTLRIVDLVLCRAARRQGVGAALLELLFAEADAAGLTVTGHVEVGNEAALQFYARAGFAIERLDATSFAIRRAAPKGCADKRGSEGR